MTEKENLQQRVDELISMTDAFCMEKLNEEYAELCRKMIEKLGRKRTVKPLATGKLNIWAAAVVSIIAANNFLFGKKSNPHISLADIHGFFDTKASTVSSKTLLVKQLLKIATRFDPEYSTEDAFKNNPFLKIEILCRNLRL